MSQVLGGIDRILARVGKRVISSDARGETIIVEALQYGSRGTLSCLPSLE